MMDEKMVNKVQNYWFILLPNLFVIHNSTIVNIKHGVQNFPMHTPTSPINRLTTLNYPLRHFNWHKWTISFPTLLHTFLLIDNLRPHKQPPRMNPNLCTQMKPCLIAKKTASYFHYGTMILEILVNLNYSYIEWLANTW